MIAVSVRRALQDDFPRRDIEALHARFVVWASKREVHAPERAFRTWVENAERDDTNRKDANAKPAVEYQPAPLGERSDPSYAAFRFALMNHVLLEKLKPDAVADLLAQNLTKFVDLPGVPELLDAEIATLRAMPANRWTQVIE